MNGSGQSLVLISAGVGAVALYLLLPRGTTKGRAVGMGLAAVAIGLLWRKDLLPP